MRRKIITPTGEADIYSIYEYLLERTPNAADAYLRMVTNTFETFPDDVWLPPRASSDMPDYVRVLHLGSPFRGYTLWVAFLEEALYLLAAFAPGLPDEFKKSRGDLGLDELQPGVASF